MKPGQRLLASHVITRLIVGGAQENTVATVLGLQQKPEFDTELISGPTEGIEGSLEPAFRAQSTALTIIPSLVRPVRPLPDVKALFDLRKVFRQRKPALVHTHSSKAGILGRLAARMERVPIIIHGVHGPSFGPWQGTAANFVFTALERWAGRDTTHFVSVANAMTEQYLAAGIGSRERYTTIFSGFALEPFLNSRNSPELRAKYGLGPADLVIGKIARMFELKGHDDLFEIAPEFLKNNPRARFLLIGGGPWENRFKEKARALGLESRFVFTGLVPPSQIPELAGVMDLLVHLSYREGLPRAIPQALAAGKPVVAYDCDGAGEVCLPGRTGFLIHPRDFPALIDALQTCARDPELRRRYGDEGQGFVRDRFSISRMVDDTHALYLRLFRQHAIPAPASNG